MSIRKKADDFFARFEQGSIKSIIVISIDYVIAIQGRQKTNLIECSVNQKSKSINQENCQLIESIISFKFHTAIIWLYVFLRIHRAKNLVEDKKNGRNYETLQDPRNCSTMKYDTIQSGFD